MIRDHYTIVTRKGQITIPIEIRRLLNLEVGDRMEVSFDGRQVTLRPSTGVVVQTAGLLKNDAPAISAEMEREQAEVAIAEEALQRS